MHLQLVTDNAELHGIIDLLEGRKTLQRDVDRWTEINVTKFNKA